MKGELLCLLLASGLVSLLPDKTGIRPVDKEPNQCEEITVPECALLGYKMTYTPNARGHTKQSLARKELEDFLPLVINKCSNAFLHFLCSFYIPACLINPDTQSIIKLQPCKDLCEYIQPGCKDAIKKSKFEWPAFFNCSFETFSNKSSCFGPNDLKAVKIPESILVTSPEFFALSKGTSLASSSLIVLSALTIAPTYAFIANLWRQNYLNIIRVHYNCVINFVLLHYTLLWSTFLCVLDTTLSRSILNM